MEEQAGIAALQASLNAIDADTTKAGNAVGEIQTKIEELMEQIQNNPDSSVEITALAEQAASIAAGLAPITETLEQLGKRDAGGEPEDPPAPEDPPVE